MPRLFTGIEIPEEVAGRLALLRGGLPGARWIDRENYHLTLRFIGNVDMDVAEDIASALDTIHRPAFDIRLTEIGTLGTKKPHAIVAKAELSPALAELQADHERVLQRIGLAPEGRKCTPHVTLARLRGATGRSLADYLSVRGGFFFAEPFRAERFVIFSAAHASGGGPYRVEETYPLGRNRRAPSHHDHREMETWRSQ